MKMDLETDMKRLEVTVFFSVLTKLPLKIIK